MKIRGGNFGDVNPLVTEPQATQIQLHTCYQISESIKLSCWVLDVYNALRFGRRIGEFWCLLNIRETGKLWGHTYKGINVYMYFCLE